MRNSRITVVAAIGLAFGLIFAGVAPASAGTIYTGSKSCPVRSYAFTSGFNPAYSTIKHFQSVNGQWWASPTSPTNLSNYSVYTTWAYSTSNGYFANSYLTTSGGNPGSPAAKCA